MNTKTNESRVGPSTIVDGSKANDLVVRGICPNCGSDFITEEEITQNDLALNRKATCLTCENSWIETFTLTAVKGVA